MCGFRNLFTYVSVKVNIRCVAASSDSFIARDSGINSIDVTERVNIDLQTRKSLVRARLESAGIASSLRIKGVDGSQDAVGIDSGADGTKDGADVGDDEAGVGPVTLEEA
jgi:hypothetical protein